MIDYFALLAQPRQPYLEPAALESKFRQRALSLHPDAAAGANSAALATLNEAFTVLGNPRLRLQHLLALEGAEQKQTTVPPEWMDLFSRAAEVASRARNELQRPARQENAITRSMNQIQRAGICEQLSSLLQELEAKAAGADEDLKILNAQWDRDRGHAVEIARALQRRFTFVQRWLGTLRELRFQLQN